MSAKVIVRDSVSPYLTWLKQEMAKLAHAEIRVGVLGSADGELLRIARVHEFGMTITPKTARNLAIPLKPDMRGKSPRDVENTWILETDDHHRFIVRDKGSDGIDFLFMLVPKVVIPERSFIRAGFDHNRSTLESACKDAILGIVNEQIDARAACNQIGITAAALIQRYMPTVQPPKSQLTLASMPSKTIPLQVTRRLLNAITYEVIGL